MYKYLYSALLNEAYREILYITCHYQDEILSLSAIKDLDETDYNNLEKSKALKNYGILLTSFGPEISPYVTEEFLEILDKQIYNEDTFTTLITYMNPYIELYNSMMHSMIDDVSSVIDIKMNALGKKGTYPLYVKIEEKKAIIERAILSTNAGTYLDKKTKIFGFRVTFIEYNVPLQNYTYSGVDLREKKREEIIAIMDNSVKVNLQHANYYETGVLPYKETDGIPSYSEGEISLFLDKKSETYGGIKYAFKESFKRTGWSFLVVIAVIIIFILIKYVFK